MFELCLSQDPNTRAQEQQEIIGRFHSPFTKAVASNNFEKVNSLLPLLTKEELNWKGMFGNTALHWAIANTRSKIALKLLEETPKLDVNQLDANNKTALHLAVAKGWYHFNDNCNLTEYPQAPVIQLLVVKTELNIKDSMGNTPLHLAVMRRDINCIDLLLQAGASIDVQNNKGQTACDMLQMDFQEVNSFLKDYASIFSLNEPLWNSNKDRIATSLKSVKDKSVFQVGNATVAPQNTLLDKINILRKYGKELKNKQEIKSISSGEKAIMLADELEKIVRQFTNPNITSEDQAFYRQQFRSTLNRGYQYMGAHRELWKPILINIAIAATGFGILAMIYRGSFFYAETARQQKTQDIRTVFESTNSSGRPMSADS